MTDIFIGITVKKEADLEYIQGMLKIIKGELKGEIMAVLEEYGERIRMDAKINAPVKTGELKASISTKFSNDMVEVTCTVPYAQYQEYMKPKTSKARPRFMRNAFNAHKDALSEAIRQVLLREFNQLKYT